MKTVAIFALALFSVFSVVVADDGYKAAEKHFWDKSHWRVWIDQDALEGKSTPRGITSSAAIATPETRLDFPYEDMVVFLLVRCEGEIILFSEQLVIKSTEPLGNIYKIRMKFDDESARTLTFFGEKNFLEKDNIKEANGRQRRFVLATGGNAVAVEGGSQQGRINEATVEGILNAADFASFDWVHWYNHSRLLEPLGYTCHRRNGAHPTSTNCMRRPSRSDSSTSHPGKSGMVQNLVMEPSDDYAG